MSEGLVGEGGPSPALSSPVFEIEVQDGSGAEAAGRAADAGALDSEPDGLRIEGFDPGPSEDVPSEASLEAAFEELEAEEDVPLDPFLGLLGSEDTSDEEDAFFQAIEADVGDASEFEVEDDTSDELDAIEAADLEDSLIGIVDLEDGGLETSIEVLESNADDEDEDEDEGEEAVLGFEEETALDELDDLMAAVAAEPIEDAPEASFGEAAVEVADEVSRAVGDDGKVDLGSLIGLEDEATDEPESAPSTAESPPARKKVAKRPTKKKIAKKPAAPVAAPLEPAPTDEAEGDLDDLFDQIQLD